MKKGKFYSGKEVLVLTIIKLLLVQVTFLLFAILIADSGNGTFVQFAIFYNWLTLPISYLGHFANSSDTISPVGIIYFLLAPLIHFTFSMLLTALVWKSKINKNNIALTILFCLAGTLFCFVSSRHEDWLFYPVEPVPTLIWIEGFVVALLFTAFFWNIFFQLVDKRYERSVR